MGVLFVCLFVGGLRTMSSMAVPTLTWKPAEERFPDLPATSLRVNTASSKCQHLADHFIYCDYMNLRAIPDDLPVDTLGLSFDGNFLETLNARMFGNLKQLKELNVRDNRIKTVENDTFSELENLSMLLISGNPLSLASFEIVLCSFRFRPGDLYLFMGSVFRTKKISLAKDTFNCLKDTFMTFLDLSDNYFGDFPDGLFAYLNVGILYLGNSISTASVNTAAFNGIRNLWRLHLDGNMLRQFPNFTRDGITFVPDLFWLNLDKNQFGQLAVEDMDGLQALEVLSLDNIADNENLFIEPGTFQTLESLKRLYFQSNCLSHITETISFRSNTISHLYVSKGLIVHNIDNTELGLFRNMPNLSVLEASSLQFDNVLGKKGINNLFYSNAFQNLSMLTSLCLSYNGLDILPAGMFNGLHQLVTLDLSNNMLSHWHYYIFSDLVSLKHLLLSRNAITVVTKEYFPQNGEYLMRLASVDLSINIFSCTCDLLWFKSLLKRQPNPFQFTDNYQCSSPDAVKGTAIELLHITESDCARTLPVAYFLAMAISCLFLISLLVISIAFRFRWHVKYLFLQLKSKHSSTDEEADDKVFAYDAFITYHASSIRWVKFDLLPLLEDKFGLKVCLHDRDWLPGRDIVDNIMESIVKSRKIVCVVTNAFARSQWCQLELTMAQHHLLEKDRNNLILILMEDIYDHNITPRLALQMKIQTYIEWNEAPKAKQLFEKKLQQVLKRPNKSIRVQAV